MESHKKLIALIEARANDDTEKFTEICHEATAEDLKYWAQFAQATLSFAIGALPIKQSQEDIHDSIRWH